MQTQQILQDSSTMAFAEVFMMICEERVYILGVRKLIYNNYIVMNSKQERTVDSQTLFSRYDIQLRLPFKISQTASRKGWNYERDGHWNEKQRLKYAIFISYFKQLFEDPTKKKSVRIYDMMSDMIVTRNSNQCRSHHQKMEKYRSTIPYIIASVAQKYEPRVYRELESKYLVLIKMLLENGEKYTRTTSTVEKPKSSSQSVTVRSKNSTKVNAICLEPTVQMALSCLEKEVMNEKKEDKIKTADSYGADDVEHVESIPMMTLDDPKCGEEDIDNTLIIPKENYQQVNMCYTYQPSSFSQTGLFSMNSSLQLTLESKSYYEEQIKMLEIKKQWHAHNAQQLSAQLLNEKQAIEHCDSTLKLYQMAINGSTSN